MLRGDDTIGPYWLERQLDPTSASFVPGGSVASNVTNRSWTLLGTLARPERAAVDPRGLVTPWEGAWSLDWWVGSEDRWYLPAREAAVRQRLLEGAPVVETAMRIQRGDAVHRAYAVSGADGEAWLVVEIENRSAAAIAVALAVRPWSVTGPVEVGSVGVEGTWLQVDGVPALHLPKAPAHVHTAQPGELSVLAAVVGGADAQWAACPSHGAEGAVVFPLPHTLALRVALPLASGAQRRRGPLQRRAAGETPAPPEPLPAAEQVASGWAAQTRRGARFELPDERLAAVVEANRRHLLLVQAGEDLVTWPSTAIDYPDVASVLGALDALGFGDEAGDVLGTWEERQALDGRFLGDDRRHDAAGAALAALGEHWRLHGDEELVESLVGPIAKAARWIDRRATSRRRRPVAASYHDAWWSWRGVRDAADLLAAIDQPDAARDAQRFSDSLRDVTGRSLEADCARLDALVLPGTPGGSPDASSLAVVEAVLLGALEPGDPRVDATLHWLRERFVVDGAVFEALGAAGLSPRWTARLARAELARGEESALERLRWLVEHATPTATWPEIHHPRTGGGASGAGHDGVAAAELLLAVRDLLVREARGAEPTELHLAPVVPATWLGQGWEAHDVPTSAGRLGYAVRWHGERPAVLWQLDAPARTGGPDDVVLRAPGLDPSWSTRERAGEALLAPVVLPGTPTGGFS